MKPRISFFLLMFLIASMACAPIVATPTSLPPILTKPGEVETRVAGTMAALHTQDAILAAASTPPTPTLTPSQTATAAPSPTATPLPLVPNFTYIVVVVFENKEFEAVIGAPSMPVLNRLAGENALLTEYYAIMHPSLPNTLALVGGETFGVRRNCEDCFQAAQSLPDLVEASGRTWKAYIEGMPAPCQVGSSGLYFQHRNPFVYFDPIRLDAGRCERSVVPLTRLDSDIATGALPNFSFIVPNLCNAGQDCPAETSDAWLAGLLDVLLPALTASRQPYLVAITWDEGQGDGSCCGLPPDAGGRVATVLVSPQAKSGFLDDTPYTHYSILKTIAEAWGLAYLGQAAADENALIVAPWK